MKKGSLFCLVSVPNFHCSGGSVIGVKCGVYDDTSRREAIW